MGPSPLRLPATLSDLFHYYHLVIHSIYFSSLQSLGMVSETVFSAPLLKCSSSTFAQLVSSHCSAVHQCHPLSWDLFSYLVFKPSPDTAPPFLILVYFLFSTIHTHLCFSANYHLQLECKFYEGSLYFVCCCISISGSSTCTLES